MYSVRAYTVTHIGVETLHSLCAAATGGAPSRRVQFFGLYFYNIAPFCYHTPPRAM